MTLEEKKTLLEQAGYIDVEYIGDDYFECKIKGENYENSKSLEIVYVRNDGYMIQVPRW